LADTIAAFFLSPLSEHSFFIRAIEKMYIARTKSKRVFTDSPPQKDFEEFEEQLSSKEKKQINRNKTIKFTCTQSVRLFFKQLAHQYCCCLVNICKEEKTDKIWNLYSHGQNRLEKEFDIVNLTKSIRYMS
jgi:hypothetical protein